MKSIYFEIIKNRNERPYIIINRRNSFPTFKKALCIFIIGDGSLYIYQLEIIVKI